MLLGALVALAAVLTVAAQPDVQPPSVHFKSPGRGALTCVFASPLTDCRVRVSDHYYFGFDKMLEFARGPQSPNVALHANIEAGYHGQGLHLGHCGVEFRLTKGIEPVALVECFGRGDNDTWSRGFGTLSAHYYDVLPLTSYAPRSILAVAGTDVSILFKTRDERRFEYCLVHTPAGGRVELWPDRSTTSDGRQRVYGAGAARGECGATLVNVQLGDAGVLKWYGHYVAPLLSVWQASVLLVQEAPKGLPTMEVRGPSVVGGLLEATCVAPPAVPPARLSWWLGGKLVRADPGNRTALADLGKSRPWDRQAVVQTFKRVLKVDDSGLVLECRMSHEALAGGEGIRHVIHVTPTTTPRPISLTAERDVVRSAVGFLSELACIVKAGPNVAVQWSRANGVPVEETDLVVTGNDGTRHWLRLEDTAAEDLGNLTCTATEGGVSASEVVQLTGLPGTPQWVGNASHFAWRVESVVPVTATTLKIRRGKGRLQEFNNLDVSEDGEGWQLVTSKALPLPPGNYAAYLQVQNEYGRSQRSPFQNVTLDNVPSTTPTPTSTPAPVPVEVHPERAVVLTAEGHRSEMACIVNALDVSVQWTRGSGVPVQESTVVVKGSDGTRHWLALEDTSVEDFTDFTCTASKAGSSVSRVVRLTGLPGTPDWAGNRSLLAWKVESAVPVTGGSLKIRRGTEKWQEFTDLVVTKMDERWYRLTTRRLPVPAGSYTTFLKVRNEVGWSPLSPFHEVILDSPPSGDDDDDDDRPILDIDLRHGGGDEARPGR